jgi:hypothetical protein
MVKDEQVELRYCPQCKSILFIWDDLVIDWCTQERYVTPDGELEYGDMDSYDTKKESETCKKGHEDIVGISISKESFNKIFITNKNSIACTISEEHHDTEISDEDFNLILLESGIANLDGGK